MFTPVPPALVAPSRRIVEAIRRYRDLIVSARPVVTICGLAVNGVNADLARAVWGPCGITINEGSFTVIPGDLDYPGWVDYTAAPAALLAQRGNCGANAIRAAPLTRTCSRMSWGISSWAATRSTATAPARPTW